MILFIIGNFRMELAIVNGINQIIKHNFNRIDVIFSMNNDELDDYNLNGGKKIIEILKDGEVVEQLNYTLIIEYSKQQYVIKYEILQKNGDDMDVSFKIIKIATSRLF